MPKRVAPIRHDPARQDWFAGFPDRLFGGI
jgi:hypothetical protein